MASETWWATFGEAVPAEELKSEAAKKFAAFLVLGHATGARLLEAKEDAGLGWSALSLEVDVDRPQDLAIPIRATENVAVIFPNDGRQPSVLALRDDFPEAYHQNSTPPGVPPSLCVDDRPWNEARLTYSAPDLVRRIQLWLTKAAKGDLHDPAQPVDPLFFTSSLSLVVPADVIAAGGQSAELAGFVRADNQNLIITVAASTAPHRPLAFTVLTFNTPPQEMARLRAAPRTLAELAFVLEGCGIDVLDELRAALTIWADSSQEQVRRLSARLVIIVVFPMVAGAGRTVNDLRAFATHDAAGEIGVALGVLYRNTVGGSAGYVRAVVSAEEGDLGSVKVEPTQVHLAFNRDLAAEISGLAAPDKRRAMLIGAGSLGSQLALTLAREGRFGWTVVDDDYLLPHNLARHGLLAGHIGAPKAIALAEELGDLLAEAADAIEADVIHPTEEVSSALSSALTSADIIIDASASVAVARHLADLEGVAGRRVSVFFNPAGTAVVVLAESADRAVTLRDLEAQYHRVVLSEPSLADHLVVGRAGVRYSGSCRSATNRIPASNATLLSAIAARGLSQALGDPFASVKIWTMDAEGRVALVAKPGMAVGRFESEGWRVVYDEGLLQSLAALREARLPNETGGVLLGIADMASGTIHVAHALPEPPDSLGSRTLFERGVVGVAAAIKTAVETSMHQLRYVGEWHSHPRLSSVMPSRTDIAQLVWLGGELQAEGLPALITIAGDDGHFSFVFRPQNEQGEPLEQSPAGVR